MEINNHQNVPNQPLLPLILEESDFYDSRKDDEMSGKHFQNNFSSSSLWQNAELKSLDNGMLDLEYSTLPVDVDLANIITNINIQKNAESVWQQHRDTNLCASVADDGSVTHGRVPSDKLTYETNDTNKRKRELDTKQATLAEVRRQRRKESNRRAADKCRRKKKTAQEVREREYNELQQENEQLAISIEELRAEKAKLQQAMMDHMSVCSISSQCAPMQ